MAYRVKFSAGEDIQGSDYDVYHLLPDGVLRVDISDETAYYSPAFWREIEPSRGHFPGLRKVAGEGDEWFAAGPTV